MAEGYKAWWEVASVIEVAKAFKKHPRAVTRQIAVACDMDKAPRGSDQETFPTLLPAEAEKLLAQGK